MKIDIEDLPRVRGKYRHGVNMSKMCWMGVGGEADLLFIPEDLDDLIYFLQNRDDRLKISVIGVGSNVIIPDSGIAGVTIRLGKGFNYIKSDCDVIIAGAASTDLSVALFAKEASRAGLEFFSGIPGTVGGALAMNAGAYGKDVKSVLKEASAVNFVGECRRFACEEIGYSYRNKKLEDSWIFVEAIFFTEDGDKDEIENKISEIQKSRAETQPIKSKTCGSTFKNPPGYKAWELIDQVGLRGFRVGGAQISTLHSNFIINVGDATAKDIQNLISVVKERVYETKGVVMEEEIKFL